MNLHRICKKAVKYISCTVKFGAARVVSPFFKNKAKYKNLWLISERGIDARDNGYYLFKYITQNHPEINIAFAISRDSSDRPRVETLGNLINRGSFAHYLALVLSKVKISTHIMGYTPDIDFFIRADKHGWVKGKKIFLQHGVTKDNITFLYSNNVNVDLFVCSAESEHKYVQKQYGYDAGAARLLGLCRYDALYKIKEKSRKILIMPTWRYDLRGAERKEFTESDYFKAFNGLLNSRRLEEILEKYNYEVLFYPHMEIQRFIDCFSGGDRVKIMSFGDCTVQELLIKTDVLITDFSSVFFDYGYMGKPMIFYQFDEEKFRKNHYSEGYFSYKRDAFGDVVYDERTLLDSLERILANGAETDGKYLDRINQFFTLRDTNNCERNFNAVKKICDRG
ncbi:MAG: CDP-glycerol glycerophosphotransferase family protein [Firmicutes bacterium]|nr:CDP-glycerol glycerophosphotransferase family protein [Bacillota bacterium]